MLGVVDSSLLTRGKMSASEKGESDAVRCEMRTRLNVVQTLKGRSVVVVPFRDGGVRAPGDQWLRQPQRQHFQGRAPGRLS